MNPTSTLVQEAIDPNHRPPALEGKEKEQIEAFYEKWNVLDKGPEEKNQALQKEIGSRNFFALGGGETIEMELRANERIYLLEHGEWWS